MRNTPRRSRGCSRRRAPCRHGHGEHGHRLDEALGLKAPLDDEVGDDHAQQRRDGGGDEAQAEGIPERLQTVVAREDELEPFAGEREELVAPSGEERADGHAQVHEDDEGGRARPQRMVSGILTLLSSMSIRAAGGLAGQGRGGLALEVILLHRKHRQRDAQQHDRPSPPRPAYRRSR